VNLYRDHIMHHLWENIMATADIECVGEIMTKNVLSAKKDDSVQQIMKVLFQKKISGLPVVDELGKVIGIASSLDLIIAGALEKMQLKLGELPLSISVTKDIFKVRKTDPIKTALLMMVKKRVNRIIVVDENDKLEGIVTRKDLVRYFYIKNNFVGE
jgi:CBS domain-containing protein